MNVPLPRVHDDAVLAGVKATPSGWPSASPDPPAPGDAHQQRPRAEQETDPCTGAGGQNMDLGAVVQQIQVSTVSGDYRLCPRSRCFVCRDDRRLGVACLLV
jgi:hypothetical protein